MPDQDKKLYDCHAHMGRGEAERYLNMYGPHSPATSDSPLSLVVRKEDAILQDLGRGSRKLGLVDSPGRSSGFSDGSYESSPQRSPRTDSYPAEAEGEDGGQAEDKPLSLVIRKSPASEETKPAYTVHATEAAEAARWSPDVEDADSGNEDSDHPLIISEEERDQEQEAPQDFSKESQELATSAATESQSTKSATGIKIKSFAKILEAAGPSTEHRDQEQQQEQEQEQEGISDVESECSGDSSEDSGAPYTLGTELEMTRVTKTASGESLYQCGFCDKLFANKYHLQSHLVTHTGERAFTCKLCNKTFGRKSTLRAHMTTHTKVSNFMCGVCEKACNDNNSLEEHMRMHTGEKPFVCSICQKAYARKSHLNVHYRVHTGERPFVCERCNKDFTEKRFLNDHLQTAHNGVDGPLKCPNCSREFAYKTSLKQHLKKQMCERNIKRSTGNLGGGAVAKQFQCPFCDKSYSWKQTLKQHVSMYHRNKVHTDEFWRYELTKNRRTVTDDKANEDLWKKQLGKHAEETARQKLEAETAAATLAALGAATQEKKENVEGEVEGEEAGRVGEEVQWLEQIQRGARDQDQGVSTELKLLALQSLQTSLRFMSMGMSVQQPAVKTEPGPAPAQETGSYLSLLAQLAKRESEERRSKGEAAAPPPAQAEPGPAPPTKEESSVKRTQLWLQQVNKYRHRADTSAPGDTAANHEELWEQQISRVKRRPVRSPLEPEEIVIEDEVEAAPPPSPAPRSRTSRASTLNNNNNNNNNNIIVNNNNSINNNNHESVTIFPARIILAHPVAPPGQAATATLTFAPASQPLKVILHPAPAPPQDTPPAPPPADRASTDTEPSRRGSREQSPASRGAGAGAGPAEDGSMLKSLLLDRMKRKRSSSNDTDSASKKSSSSNNTTGESKSSKSSRPIPIPDAAPNDILRKRLLGWVDPPQPPAPAPQDAKPAAPAPASPPAPAAPRSQSSNGRGGDAGGAVFQLELEAPAASAASEDKKKENVVTYANTSVLKHLLHRYTETKQ